MTIDFEYSVVRRSRRKTISISVSPENIVTVAVPRNLPDERVREVVAKKSGWIRSKMQLNLDRRCTQPEKHYVSGETFYYLGNRLILEVVLGGRGEVVLENGTLHVAVSPQLGDGERREWVRARLAEWYRSCAVDHLRERVKLYESTVGVRANVVRVKSLKSRWGSCSSKGNLHFCWNIIMAPQPIIDYVIVHELCHLVHMDHSPDYWNLVESIVPDYRARRQWLRTNGWLLSL